MRANFLKTTFVLFVFLFIINKDKAFSQSLNSKIFPKPFKTTVPDKIILKENNTVYFLTTEVNGTTGGESTYLNSSSLTGTVKSEKVKFPKAAEGAKEKNANFYSFNNKIYAFVDGVNKESDTRDFYAIEFDKATLIAKPEVKKLASSEKISIGIFSGQSYSCLFSPDSKKVAVILKANQKIILRSFVVFYLMILLLIPQLLILIKKRLYLFTIHYMVVRRIMFIPGLMAYIIPPLLMS